MTTSRELADALIEVVRARMAEQGLSVNRLAAEVGVTQSTLDRQLKGRGDLSIDSWEAIAETLGAPLAELLEQARTRM